MMSDTPNTNPVDENIKRIEQAWLDRAKAQFLKPGTKIYAKAELEFFMGAMAAINSFDTTNTDPTRISTRIPPRWVICLMSGRDVVTMK